MANNSMNNKLKMHGQSFHKLGNFFKNQENIVKKERVLKKVSASLDYYIQQSYTKKILKEILHREENDKYKQ
jgi:hypothetical protein